MSTARFSRLFDEWEHDADITFRMVDLGETNTPESQTYRSPTHSPDDLDIERYRANDTDADSNDLSRVRTLPSFDETSTRSLLRGSVAKTADFDIRKSSHGSIEGEPRQRPGFGGQLGGNFQRLWHKKSVLSSRTVSTFDGRFEHGRPGLWNKQMLVDRSLRSMAGFTAMCGFIMLIITLCYVGDFVNRLNRNTTSVGGKEGESCKTMEQRNVAVHLFINIAGTMILGCSNTYQQLVTALKVDEIRWILSKRGDSRVGTNSPWAINHKREGKTKAWLSWLLLIGTSLPVHFLANSVIGPSFYIHMPSVVDYKLNNDTRPENSDDPACWTAFRSGQYVLPVNTNFIDPDYHTESLGNSTTYLNVEVQYTLACVPHKDNTDYKTALSETSTDEYGYKVYAVGNCSTEHISCQLSDPEEKKCRMNVRMEAAFILTGCLFIKAIYMISLIIFARHQTKDRCLTYGDVIVASVLNPSLKIQNECLLNSGEGWRQKVEHTCHKHCKDPVPSMTGDDIGHCQKCKKFNKSDKAADLPHPSIAIKYKKSLLANLGSTALVQMITLMILTLAMLSISIVLLVAIFSTKADYHNVCSRPRSDLTGYEMYDCDVPVSTYLKDYYGTWGGFSSSATLSPLPADSLGSEFTAFAVSNGAQFLYSLLYLLLVYNITLISMEHEWGGFELGRKRPRCTLVRGKQFEQSYFLQLPSKVLMPLMVYAALMHWLLGQAISTTETIFTDPHHGIEHSIYFVTYAAYPIFLSTVLMITMTAVCWWAFTYTREGFIPQMYGSIRACCASTTELEDFSYEGIQWGDLGMGEKFRHAGFTSDEPAKIIPAELYCGKGKTE